MSKFRAYYNLEIERYKGIENYIDLKAKEKKIFLEKIKKYADTKKEVIEAGCGSASNSIFLANNGLNVTCIDNDLAMLNFAKRNAKLFHKKPIFIKQNLFKLSNLKKQFEVAFSHGVLEHYGDKDILKLVNIQLTIAEYVIVSIPSDFFRKNQAINGDERFLNKNYWYKLLSNSNGEIIETFDYFYDSTEFKINALRLISKITLGKLPIRKPYVGFVIKRK